MYACDNELHQSSVPSYPVNLRINTEAGEYVNFVPENMYSHMTVDDLGYHFNGKTLPLTIGIEPHGYIGTVIFINGGGEYVAYDLCCPQCYTNGLRKGSAEHALEPLKIDGIFAECPICGARYDLSCYGVPQKGAKEALRPFTTTYFNHIVTVRNL